MSNVFTREENQLWAKSLPGKMCSACIAIVADQKVLMVKASYKDHWTFPSGIVDDGESPKKAAIRETAEEIGVDIPEDKLELLAAIYTTGTSGDRDRFNIGFISYLTSLPIQLNVPTDEIEKAEWVSYEDVANRSGNKPSYTEFQNKLISMTDERKYIEL